MTSTNEATIAKRRLTVREQQEALRIEEAALTAAYRQARQEAEAQRCEQSAQALAEAQQTHDERQAALEAAKASQRALEARLDAGDVSVTVEDLTTAKIAKDRAQRLYNATREPLAEATAEHQIDLRPTLLMDRAIDIFTTNTEALGLAGYDQTWTRRPDEFEPAVLPAVVFSPLSIGDMDKAVKQGTVMVKVIGDAVLDPEAVSAAFSDKGCTVSLDGDVLTFHEAVWDVPIIPRPSLQVFHDWADTVCQVWRNEVTVVKVGNTTFSNSPLSNIEARPETVKIDSTERGKALGSVTIEASADGYVDPSQVEIAMQRSIGEMVGLSTEFGLIERIEIGVTERRGTGSAVVTGYSPFGRELGRRGIDKDLYWTITLSVHTVFTPPEDM